MQDIKLPDKVVKRIKIPVLGYNTLKFVIYFIVGIVIAFIMYGVTRSWSVFGIVVGIFSFAAFAFSVVRINGEVDLDVYLFSLLGGKERAIKGPAAARLVSISSVSKDGTMLKVGGSYLMVLEASGETVAVMSEEKARWYFDGFLQYQREASPKFTVSIVSIPVRYDPTPLVMGLKPRAGKYFGELADQYREYLNSFKEIRAYTSLVVLRVNPLSLFSSRNVRGVDMEQVARRELGYEADKVARNLGSKGISIRLVAGDELMLLCSTLYQGGF
ncbi:MAG: hypothetical protein QXU18_10550 [Thermoplasmatales archaeon]